MLEKVSRTPQISSIDAMLAWLKIIRSSAKLRWVIEFCLHL